MNKWERSVGGMILTRQSPSNRRYIRPRAISYTTNAAWTGVGMNMCHRLKRAQNNRLNHGTARTKYGKFRNRKLTTGSQKGNRVVIRLSEVIILAWRPNKTKTNCANQFEVSLKPTEVSIHIFSKVVDRGTSYNLQAGIQTCDQAVEENKDSN